MEESRADGTDQEIIEDDGAGGRKKGAGTSVPGTMKVHIFRI